MVKDTGGEVPRFRRAFTTWRKGLTEGSGALEAKRDLQDTYREAWVRGERKIRKDVLLFLMLERPAGGEEIVWQGLGDSRNEVRHLALSAAVNYVTLDRVRPDASALRALRKIVDSREVEGARVAALLITASKVDEDLLEWVKDLAASDESPEIRRQANLILASRGNQAAKSAMLSELNEHPNHHGVADALWNHRDTLELTTHEAAALRSAIERYVDWLASVLHDANKTETTISMAVRMLGKFARDGFAIRDEETELIRHRALSAADVEDRLAAIETLHAIDTEASRLALAEVGSNGKPIEVSRRARLLLSKAAASDPKKETGSCAVDSDPRST